MLARAGIRFSEDVASSRKLIFSSDDDQFRVVLVKPADVPTYVEYGAADLGIAGRDVIMESRADLLQPLDLNFGHCKLAVAGPNGKLGEDASQNSGAQEFWGASPNLQGASPNFHHPTIRVATKYPRITLDYYNARGI